jgi:hypothetical protein
MSARGLALYAAVVALSTVALIAIVITFGADGGRLERLVRLQAPVGRAGLRALHAEGMTPARGRVPSQPHLRLQSAVASGMKPAVGSTQLDDDECICDEAERCYVCFVHHEPHGHGHGHGEEHGEEHEEHKAVQSQKLTLYDHKPRHSKIGMLGEEGHDGHHGHHGHHSIYGKGHVYHTDIKFFRVIPDCCEHPSIHQERDPDSSYNQPCSMDEAELEPFANMGEVKVCDEHDMQDAQTNTHHLNVWLVMFMTIIWMVFLIWAAEQLKNCGGVHEHGHGHHDHHHEDHEDGDGDEDNEKKH